MELPTQMTIKLPDCPLIGGIKYYLGYCTKEQVIMLDRTEIRQKVVALLKNQTSVGEHVYDSKLTPHASEALPAISVMTTLQKGTAPAAATVPTFNTVLTLKIGIYTNITDDWAAKIDAICEEVEEKVLKNPDFIAQSTQIQGYTTELTYKPYGDTPVAGVVISLYIGFDLIFDPIYPGDFDDFNQTKIDLKVSDTVKAMQAELTLERGERENAKN